MYDYDVVYINDFNVFNAVDKAIKSIRETNNHIVQTVVPRLRSNDRNIQRLVKAAYVSRDELIRANTVFPFVLFPDTIVIDREKLTIAHRSFFRVARVVSVPIEDILSVEVDLGPFFGSIHITSKYFVQNPQTMEFLNRHEAIKIQRLLQGYIIALEKGIECSDIDKETLCTLLTRLGEGVSE